MVRADGALGACGGVMVHAAAAKAAQKTNTRCNIWELAGLPEHKRDVLSERWFDFSQVSQTSAAHD
jgi:RecB family exonuclease